MVKNHSRGPYFSGVPVMSMEILLKKSAFPSRTLLLLLLSGDIETNPGPLCEYLFLTKISYHYYFSYPFHVLAYEDYAGRIVQRNKLYLVFDKMHEGVEKHLLYIAKDLDDLDGLTTKLELQHQVIEDIQSEHKNLELQRYDT